MPHTRPGRAARARRVAVAQSHRLSQAMRSQWHADYDAVAYGLLSEEAAEARYVLCAEALEAERHAQFLASLDPRTRAALEAAEAALTA